MRKVTEQTARAFARGEPAAAGNTSTNGCSVQLHGNTIAWRTIGADGRPHVTCTLAGWPTHTTRDRLNGILTYVGPFVGPVRLDGAVHDATGDPSAPWSARFIQRDYMPLLETWNVADPSDRRRFVIEDNATVTLAPTPF